MTLVDNNILSSMAKTDRLGLLESVFESVATTPSVLDELHRDAVAGYEFVERIDDCKVYNGGWLEIHPPTQDELQRTEEIIDATLSFTDAECIAIAEHRDERLLTDDGHVGEIATQRGVAVWDLSLFIEACILRELIEDEQQLDAILATLRDRDGYEFSAADTERLYERL